MALVAVAVAVVVVVLPVSLPLAASAAAVVSAVAHDQRHCIRAFVDCRDELSGRWWLAMLSHFAIEVSVNLSSASLGFEVKQAALARFLPQALKYFT